MDLKDMTTDALRLEKAHAESVARKYWRELKDLKTDGAAIAELDRLADNAGAYEQYASACGVELERRGVCL